MLYNNKRLLIYSNAHFMLKRKLNSIQDQYDILWKLLKQNSVHERVSELFWVWNKLIMKWLINSNAA